jgi:hypothetical protein
VSPRSATTVWRIAPALVAALDERLDSPIDSYVNGTQTWLTDDGPNGTTLEWRLHPVASYQPPTGLSHYDLWESVVGGLAAGADPSSLALGGERRPLTSLWDGLECFAAHGATPEPAPLAAAATAALGLAPDAAGLVDHGRIGDAWERSRRSVSIVALLFEELEQPPSPAADPAEAGPDDAGPDDAGPHDAA